MRMTRRDFLVCGTALGGVVANTGGLRAQAPSVGVVSGSNESRLRIGILSDTHLDNGSAAAQKLKRAFEAFRRGRVDGVLVCRAPRFFLPQPLCKERNGDVVNKRGPQKFEVIRYQNKGKQTDNRRAGHTFFQPDSQCGPQQVIGHTARKPQK